MKIATKQHIVIVMCSWLFSFAAVAQYASEATMDIGTGYGQIALSQSTMDGTRKMGERAVPADNRLAQNSKPNQARKQALMKQIEPEYNLRLRRDGKLSADRWLAATARELGRQEGSADRAAADGGKREFRPPDKHRAGNKDCKRIVWQVRSFADFSGGMHMTQVPVCVKK